VWEHPFQPSQAAASQEVHQDGFGLVIGCVPYSYSLSLVGSCLLEKEPVAQIARRLLNRKAFVICVCAYVYRLAHVGKVHRFCYLLHVGSFFCRLRTQLVVQVSNNDRIASLVQQVHQTQAVWST
jgi:hypothetical protein